MKILFASFLSVILFGSPANLQAPVELELPRIEIQVIDASEYLCLQKNLYYEARNQGEAGMIAVAAVTLNRVDDKRWPDSVCGVVRQKYRGICQFSWVCQLGYKSPTLRHPGDAAAWDKAGEISKKALTGKLVSNVGKATHYHATYVNPQWRLKHVATIGDHKFFK